MAWVEAQFDASRRGKKELKLNSSRDIKTRHEPSCGGGGQEPACIRVPGSGLRLGGRVKKRRAKTRNEMEKKKKKKKKGSTPQQHDGIHL